MLHKQYAARSEDFFTEVKVQDCYNLVNTNKYCIIVLYDFKKEWHNSIYHIREASEDYLSAMERLSVVFNKDWHYYKIDFNKIETVLFEPLHLPAAYAFVNGERKASFGGQMSSDESIIKYFKTLENG